MIYFITLAPCEGDIQGHTISQQSYISNSEFTYEMRVGRREVMKSAAGSGIAAIAGCLDEDTTNTNSSGSGDDSEENCRIETRTETEILTDKSDSVSAGAEWVFYPDLEEGDVLIIEARKMGGEARPALEVEDPYGNIIVENDPSKMIHREVKANHEGRYYVRFPNEALLNSGMWDIKLSLETEYQEEVCS